ncbi:CHRNA7 [Scenedesmus sp. PABB004]|nr:CHRNA7 [Scenedesmus sp. PABB004]
MRSLPRMALCLLLLELLSPAPAASTQAPRQRRQQQQRQQHEVPPALAAAQARAAAAAAAAAATAPPEQRRRALLAAGAAAAARNATAEEARLAALPVGSTTEVVAETVLRASLLEGYDANVFPWAEAGPANVSVNLALHKILDVDLYGGTLNIAVWHRLEWTDPRLTWDAAAFNVSRLWFANAQQGDTEIWQPDVVLWNGAQPIASTLGQEPLAVDPGGRVFWSRPGTFLVACNFRGLSAYPFGLVRCSLELGSWVYGPRSVDLHLQGKGYTVGGSITSVESTVWTEYTIAGVEARRFTYPPLPCCPHESGWPVVLIDVALERQNLIYLMKVIVPQIILTAIAFSTFWLSPACGERLGLAVTVPLAVAVYDLLTFSQLPVSNRVTLVSAMGLMAFLFSMAVLVENALVLQLWHHSEHGYFRGMRVLAATGLAYREQLVWVKLLGCVHQLRVELVRRQLGALQGRRLASRSQFGSKQPTAHAKSGLACEAAVRDGADAADAAPDVRPAEGNGSDGGGSAGGGGMLGRARGRVLAELGEVGVQMGLERPGEEDAAARRDAALLSCTTRDELRVHLAAILASRQRALAPMQRRLAKANALFGEDARCGTTRGAAHGAARGAPRARLLCCHH